MKYVTLCCVIFSVSLSFSAELFNQLSTPGTGETTSSISTVGYNFTGAADDFVVPVGSTWHVKAVQVTGRIATDCRAKTNLTRFFTTRVRFFSDIDGLPGDLVATLENQPTILENGLASINLDEAVVLVTGNYWICVQFEIGSDNCPFLWQTSWSLTENPFAREGNDLVWNTCGGVVCDNTENPDLDPDLMFALHDSHLFSSVPTLNNKGIIIFILAFIGISVRFIKTRT